MSKKATFKIDSSGRATNIMRLSGIVYVDREGVEATEKQPAGDWVMGFDEQGYRRFFFNGEATPKEKEDTVTSASNSIGVKYSIPLIYDGRLSIDIIDDIFISPNSGNLIISSIAPKTALFVAEQDKFVNLEDLRDELSLALVDATNGKTVEINWDDYLA